MNGLSESRKVSDAQRRHCGGYSKFTLPYREPNGSLFGFQNGTMTHCILYPQHVHMDNNISSNGYMRGRYFKTILILIVMYMQVMQAMLILAKKHYWSHTFHDLRRSSLWQSRIQTYVLYMVMRIDLP